MAQQFIRLNADEAQAIREMIEAQRREAPQLLDPFDPLTTAYEKAKAFAAAIARADEQQE
jgi:hypothetical protein